MKPLKILLKPEEVEGSFLVDWDLPVGGITDHSEKVNQGYIFVVRKGASRDGKDFIPRALQKGAVLLLREDEIETDLPVAQIKVSNVKEGIFRILSRYYDEPQKKLTFVGITGTNGKTSATFFIKELSKELGVPACYIGTLYYEIGEIRPSQETTPSLFTLMPLWKEAVGKGIKLCAMEVSSHALHQDRIYGMSFDVCGFTNLSRDHLDYHESMDAYYESKKRLFTFYLKSNGKAVISLESDFGKRLVQELKGVLPSGSLFLVNDGNLQVRIIERDPFLKLSVLLKNKGEYVLDTKLVGDFQAKNLALALGVMYSLGFPWEEILSCVEGLTNPPGRLELAASQEGWLVFVDYAHTPEALKSALESLRPLKKGRLLVLFGCGGNRDPGKRPLMGKVAEEIADFLILTSDNPRFEDPRKILEDIEKGLEGKKPYLLIVDREKAISQALSLLQPGDILLIAGKGHEDYQEIQGQRIPFSDREVVKKLVAKMDGGKICASQGL